IWIGVSEPPNWANPADRVAVVCLPETPRGSTRYRTPRGAGHALSQPVGVPGLPTGGTCHVALSRRPHPSAYSTHRRPGHPASSGRGWRSGIPAAIGFAEESGRSVWTAEAATPVTGRD